MTPITQASPMVGSLALSMGRRPKLTLATLVDLGLSDDGIGRYFKVNPAMIRSLRRKHGMEPRNTLPATHAASGGTHQVGSG